MIISAETGRILALALVFSMGVVVGWIFGRDEKEGVVDSGDKLVDN